MPRFNAIVVVAAALFLLCLFGSCDSKGRPTVERTSEQTYQVEPDVAIRIGDPCGAISIRGVDSSELKVSATKRSTSLDQLGNIGVTVSAQRGDVLIKTNLIRQKKKPFFGGGDSVDYVLLVPRTAKITRIDMDDGKVSIEGMQGAEVRANVVDGELAVRNCAGNVELALENGALDLSYDASDASPAKIEARVLNGNVRLSLLRGGPFHVLAETQGGKISNGFSENVEVNGGGSRQIDLSSGKPPRSEISLRVTSGDISVTEANRDGNR